MSDSLGRRGIINRRSSAHIVKKWLDLGDRLRRAMGSFVWTALFRRSSRFLFDWRRFLLRCLCAEISHRGLVYPSSRKRASYYLQIEDGSCPGPDADFYCVDRIHFGRNANVSPYPVLSPASDDIQVRNEYSQHHSSASDQAPGNSRAIIGPDVNVSESALIAARAVVVKDVHSRNAVSENPARFRENRVLREIGNSETQNEIYI